MEQIGRLTFLTLDGDAPPELELDPLPPAACVLSTIEAAFRSFFLPGAVAETILNFERPTPPASGLHVIYVYGHAWLTPQGPQTAVRIADKTVLVSAFDLLTQLLSLEAAPRTILVLDCCYAAAFGERLGGPILAPRLVVFGCAANEKAIALLRDNSTRLSLWLARRLGGRSPKIDLIRVISDLSDVLDRDGVIHGQQVSYRMNGAAILLTRGSISGKRPRDRTVARVRNVLIVLGAMIAVVVIGAVWFYWSHALIDIDLAGLPTIASGITLSATEETPATNGSRVFEHQVISGASTRFWAPAADLVLRIDANYVDGAERGLAFHLDLKPGFNITTKTLHLALPPAPAVSAHPGMAYIPATAWYHGRERESRRNDTPFWIDIRPPTVDEYRPIAEELLRTGRLRRDNSFILTAETRSKAVDAVGLGQLRSLNSDLGAILGTIDQSSSSHVAAPGDVAVGLKPIPCPACPAVMTHDEAVLYCASQHKRLPTDLEWELAVRGVDGRVYPWGNEFDETRANVPGLPKKGEPPPTLKPVDAYKNELSPFGLIDTVGNAGDWVADESGFNERVYMGATYRFNPEDATAFRMLPVTDSDYLVQEITARCARDAEAGDR